MSGINHVAVWVAGIIQFVLGAGWYTALGRIWMAGIGKDEIQLAAEMGHSPLPYIVSLATGVVIAYTLAWLLPRIGAASAAAGAKTGVVLGLGLIGSTLAQNYAFEARPISLWLVNAGYMVVGMGITGGILGQWRKTA